MTQKEYFTVIRTYVQEDPDLVAFVDKQIEKLSKKRTSVNSKAKAETDARAEKVFNALSEMTEPVTLTELAKLTSDEEVAGYSNQRMSALVRKLGDRVHKEMVKGKAYFSIA